MAEITGTAKHLSTTSLVHMGLRLTLRYLRCKSVARVHASIHRYVGAHRIASFQPRNGSPRLHVLITQYAPLLQYNLVHPPWYPVLCHGVVGVYTVRHGPRRSILCVYGPGQRIWPAMKRISSPAHTFLHGGCPRCDIHSSQPCRVLERTIAYVWPACFAALPYDPCCGKIP